jgi:multiple sugar transport system substrate-binding protein
MPGPSQDSSSNFSYPPGWGETIKEKPSSGSVIKPSGFPGSMPEAPASERPATISSPASTIKDGGASSPTSPSSNETITALHQEDKSTLGIFKKILPILLFLLILGGGGFAIFKFVLPRFQKPEEVSLTYWGLWEPDNVMKNVLSEWEQNHPEINIKYVRQSHREYRERLQSALARNEVPDIFRFHITWLPMFKNELEPVPSTVMSASQFADTFYPVATRNLRTGGGYLGIPLEVDTLALFYNREIFQAAGKTPPASWDELRTLALELTTKDESGKIQTAGVALGTTNNVDHWSDILGLMMLQNGADLTNPTGSLAEDALTFYTIFNNTDRVWDETLPTSSLAFATGKVAMYFGFSWDVFEIKNINSNLDFRIVPVPQLPGTDLAWASFWVEGVAKKSDHKEEAWEFLKFLSSSRIMEKLYQAESKVRLFGEPYSRIEMASKLEADSMVAPFAEQALKAQTWYLCSRTWDNGLNDRMIKYFEDAINAVNTGDSSVAEALETTSSGVAQLLSQYGLATRVAPVQ